MAIPHSRILALAAALLIYSGGDLWQNISWPAFFSFDETLEVDYVYQLTQGHLPTFFGGAEFNPLHLDYPYDVQWRYQHPPLFYLLEVPVFLLTDALHHPIRGIWAMRVLVWVMGIVLIICSRWTAKWVSDQNKFVTDLTPIIVAANRCLPSVVFNYTLASLWVTLLIGMTAKLIRTLPDRPSGTQGNVAAWTLMVSLAPLTRLSTIPILGLCMLVICIALLQYERRLYLTLCLIVIPMLLAMVSSAWFYIRLYALSGNFTGSQPQWSSEHLQRNTHMTFVEALLDISFYKSAMSQYQNSAVTATPQGWAFIILLTIAPLIFGLVSISRRLIAQYQGRNRRSFMQTLLMSFLLYGALLGTLLQQLLFYKQGGSANAVYFSLISIVFALLIGMGFNQFSQICTRLPYLFAYCWLTIKLVAFLYETQLRWPFAKGAVMEQSSSLMQAAVVVAIASTITGVIMAMIAMMIRYTKRA